MNKKAKMTAFGVLAFCVSVGFVACTAKGSPPDDKVLLWLDKSEAEVALNQTLTLTASITPASAASRQITWTSSDTSVAEVNGSGVVKGLEEGTVVITASLSDEITAECAVSVVSVLTGGSGGHHGIVNAYSPDLVVKFGFKENGYSLNTLSAQDVTDTLNALSGYLKNQDASAVNPSEGLGGIALGDYIDLPSLNVAEYKTGDGTVIASAIAETNSQIGELSNSDYHGYLLRLLLVSINPYYNKNGNGTTTPHVIFHFQNLPGQAKMEATATNANGYTGSAMRGYLTEKYWTGLQNAGVPAGVVWEVSRRVINGAVDGVDVVEDKLWLPTMREMGASEDNIAYENNTYQTVFAYYSSQNVRKYNKENTAKTYWTAARMRVVNDSFRVIDAGNYPYMMGHQSDATLDSWRPYAAPAFCVK